MMQTAEDYVKKHKAFQDCVRGLFSTTHGKDILQHLKEVYVDGSLYHKTDRDTAFALGQREVILDLVRIAEGNSND